MSTSVGLPASVRPFVPPPPPKTPKSAGTRQRLLDLAAELFIERGYDAVSMRDIASAAKLTKGAVYGHFRSKGQLLVEVIRSKIAERDRTIDYVEARANPERGVALIHDEAGRDIRLLEVDAAAAARHDPEIAAGLMAFYLERHARIRDADVRARRPRCRSVGGRGPHGGIRDEGVDRATGTRRRPADCRHLGRGERPHLSR